MKTIACSCCALLTATVLLGQTKPVADDPKPIENSLGMKFVKVPGVPVTFSIWETRVRDYRAFADETRRESTQPDFEQTQDDPVVNVSWEDAAAFCQWLTARERKTGRLTDKQRYRLPTDAEWSAAVDLGAERGRTPEDRLQASVVWPWGHTWPPQPGDGNYAPELETDQFTNTSPVGRFKPNAHGLFDLGGNAWEWCDDWYNDARVTKALRGGSFHDSQPKDLLAAYRFSGTVHLSNDDIGFRVVLQDDTLADSGTGPRQQVLFYDIVEATPPKLVKAFGDYGGIGAGIPGQITPTKFWGIRRLGMDAAGNPYVAMSEQGSLLRSFTSDGKLLWELHGEFFCGVAELGVFNPGPTVGGVENTGWIDLLTGINAFKRSTGEHLVFVEENYKAKSLIYCWKP